ncbi:MAG: MAE_28990/MAE_18760 family HEPN-like nuclease [Polaromonas sp.]|nr:MAE_28990/MAE_18760 family HEPN-like nuclease [Polaromonas sp.]
MTPEQAHEELELDRGWREAEIYSLQNLCSNLASEQYASMRRALALLIYAHAEGFTKLSLNVYLRAINDTELTCGQVKEQIAAATLREDLKKLRDPMAKHIDFPNEDQRDVHSLFIESQFIGNITNILATKVDLPDSTVDTESNLWPRVLKRNLYRLALPDQQFRTIYGNLNKLVQKRNGIGHGADKDTLDIADYEAVRDCTFDLMRNLQGTIFSAISTSLYRRDEASA